MNSIATKKSPQVLILESTVATAVAVTQLLPVEFSCQIVHSLEEAEFLLDSQPADLLLCADDLPAESGLMFLARTRHKWENMKRILMVPDPDGDLFFDALREVPQLSFVSKPLEKRALLRVIHHALWESHIEELDDVSKTSPSFQKSLGPDPSKEASALLNPTRILILESDGVAASHLATLLPWGCRHRSTASIESAEELLQTEAFDLLLCADDFPEESGLMFLARTRDKWAPMKRILMVADPDGEFFFQVSHEVPHLRYLRKPVNKPELLHLLRLGLHDYLHDEEEAPEEETSPAISRGLLSFVMGTLAIVICAAFVFGVLELIYQLKCKLGDYFPNWHFTDFLQP